MEFISRILKYLFWLLVVSWSVALLRRIVGRMVAGATQSAGVSDAAAAGAGGGQNAQNGTPARRLVRDPVCGMHVAEELAIPFRDNGELVHFCSMGCREKYAASVQRKAANG